MQISGPPVGVAVAQTALKDLFERLQKGLAVRRTDVDASVKMAMTPSPVKKTRGKKTFTDIEIKTTRKVVTPRSPGQAEYINVLSENELVFAVGPAGTGKTYLAVATGVSMLLRGKVDRIILSRPAVEAGERLGFLPGDMREKIDPYLRPLYDALYDMLPAEQVKKRMENDQIEVAPLAYMRGRTLSNSYVILDEAQNTTRAQMKMFLTRMGAGSYMVITGDLTQIDLPRGAISGLNDAVKILRKVPDIALVYLKAADIVRHKLVTKIVNAYEQQDKTKT